MRYEYAKLLGPATLLIAASGAAAQDAAEAPTFQDYAVSQIGTFGEVEVSTRGGQEELVLTRASVLLEGAQLSEGVIEFDVAFDDQRGFAGLMWHVGEDPGDYEYFYMRKHKSGLPDAGQYTPARGGLTAWQIYSDANAMAPFAFTHDGWNRIRFVIADDKADIYFNGSPRPVLHVPDLATDRGVGGIGFRTSGPNGAMRIANLVVRELAEGEGIVGSPKEVEPPPGVDVNDAAELIALLKASAGTAVRSIGQEPVDPALTAEVQGIEGYDPENPFPEPTERDRMMKIKDEARLKKDVDNI